MATGMTHGKNPIEFYVDDDFDKNLLMLDWHPSYNSRTGKLAAIQTTQKGSNGKQVVLSLHRIVMRQATGNGTIIDHKDGNPANNRKDNLRLCTGAENNHNQAKNKNNTSGFKGVSYHKPTGKYVARIIVDSKQIWLGRFDAAEEAHEAYCSAAIKYHGDYANFG